MFVLQVHQERAGQGLRAHQAPLDLVVPLDVQDMPALAVPRDLLDTVTPPSALVFRTTGMDTEVRKADRGTYCHVTLIQDVFRIIELSTKSVSKA